MRVPGGSRVPLSWFSGRTLIEEVFTAVESGPRAQTGAVGTEISVGEKPLLGLKEKKKRRGSVEEKVAQRALCVACLGNAFVSLSHPLSPPAVSAAAVVSS